jgi:hypothetical protein
LRNGDQYKLYKVYQLGEAGKMTRNGLKVLLRELLEIKLQNVHPVFALELTIIATKSGQKVFQKATSEFGVISVRN